MIKYITLTSTKSRSVLLGLNTLSKFVILSLILFAYMFYTSFCHVKKSEVVNFSYFSTELQRFTVLNNALRKCSVRLCSGVQHNTVHL